MMKKFWFIFMILNFTWAQAMALTCGINCAVQDSLTKQTKNVNKTASNQDHSCCHGMNDKRNKKEKEKKSSCMDGLGGSCVHKIASDNVALKIFSKLTSKLVFFQELPILNIIKLFGINNRYRPKIPNLDFLNFKASLNLYILKDQFLI